MRKVAVIIVIIILSILKVNAIFGESKSYKNENLMRAGQEALAIREVELKKLAQEINDYVQQISRDGKATDEEMMILEKKVAEFKKKKKKADKHLRIYELVTKTELKPEIRRLVKEYKSSFFCYRNKKDKVRQLFAYLTGKDIKVESKIVWPEIWICLGVFLISLFFFCVGARKKNEILTEWSFLFMISPIIYVVICFLLCLM